MEITAPDQAAGQRLDAFLAKEISDLSRSRIQALIKAGDITLNGAKTKPRESLTPGDTISVIIPDAIPAEAEPEDIPLDVLYEDEHLIVINKAEGMVVHPAAGNPNGTLVNALLHHCGDLSGIGGVERPGIVHRLDKDTSGCLVAAKSDLAHQGLVEAFSNRTVTKIYLAAIEGTPAQSSGLIENQIGRHPVDRKRMAVLPEPKGKHAATEWSVASTHQDCALIRCRLLTGRTHQIRVHMKESLGHPILGDPIYAKPSRQPLNPSRLMLHALHLSFEHPITKETIPSIAPAPEAYTPWLTQTSTKSLL